MLNSLRHWGPPRPDDGLWNGNEEKHPWIIRLCEQAKCPPCYLSVIQQEQTRRWGGRIGTRFNSFWRANDVMNRRESGIIPSSSFFFFFIVVDYVFRESENVCIFFFWQLFFTWKFKWWTSLVQRPKKISHFLLVLDSCFIFLLSKSKVQQAAKKVFQILSSIQHTV